MAAADLAGAKPAFAPGALAEGDLDQEPVALTGLAVGRVDGVFRANSPVATRRVRLCSAPSSSS